MDGDDDDIPDLIEHTDYEAIESATTQRRVPLTIICGFLGAGKSTLLKRILTERHGHRIAVIVNEFGDSTDIESRTINVSSPDDPTAAQSKEILELANGCLCCSIKDTGIAAIEKLMQRKGAFDHILLETTGLADPGPIASIFWRNEEFAAGLGRDIKLDGVVCVVDAVFGEQQMKDDHSEDQESIGESLRQIAGSDVILLNKIDLVDAGKAAHVEELIHHLNPVAPIYRTIRAGVDPKVLLDISAFSSPPRSHPLPHSSCQSNATCMNHDHGHLHKPTHYELQGISSQQITFPPLVNSSFEKLDEWIRTVLWERHLPGENREVVVLRCKGLLLTESGEKYLLQGVRSLYEIERFEEDSSISSESKVVFIGKGLDECVRKSLLEAIKC